MRVQDWHTYFVGRDDWGFSVWAHNAEYTLEQVLEKAKQSGIDLTEAQAQEILARVNTGQITLDDVGAAARAGKFNDLPAVRPRSVDRVDPPVGKQVHESGKLEGVTLNEPQIFVVNENGELIHAPRGNPRTGAKHTELTAGGPAKAAGEFMQVGENKIQINNQSGRYIRQSPQAVQRVADYLTSLGYEVEIVTNPF